MLRRAVDRHIELAVLQPAHVDFLGDPERSANGHRRRLPEDVGKVVGLPELDVLLPDDDVRQPADDHDDVAARVNGGIIALAVLFGDWRALRMCSGSNQKAATSAASETLCMLRVIPPPCERRRH